MTTVELLEKAISLARRSGYTVREEWLDGAPSGVCEVKGRKLLFLDSADSPIEQLDVVLNALWADENVCAIDISAELEEEMSAARRRTAA